VRGRQGRRTDSEPGRGGAGRGGRGGEVQGRHAIHCTHLHFGKGLEGVQRSMQRVKREGLKPHRRGD
jgi:hypothetical protein